jgi:hypothetical protein
MTKKRISKPQGVSKKRWIKKPQTQLETTKPTAKPHSTEEPTMQDAFADIFNKMRAGMKMDLRD